MQGCEWRAAALPRGEVYPKEAQNATPVPLPSGGAREARVPVAREGRALKGRRKGRTLNMRLVLELHLRALVLVQLLVGQHL